MAWQKSRNYKTKKRLRLEFFRSGKLRAFSFMAIFAAVGSVVYAMTFAATSPTSLTYALGSATSVPVNTTCANGYKCEAVKITCPNIQQSQVAYIGEKAPAISPKGVMVFFTGSGGNTWYSEGGSYADSGMTDLVNKGYKVVQVKWSGEWLSSSSGEQAGPANLACRPATALKWIFDKKYAPLGIAPGLGKCGFCATGNSGGSSQVSYALSFYGLDTILNAVVPTSGPPHAALAKGCLRNPGEDAYWYRAGVAIDRSYGYPAGSTNGPCSLHDTSFQSRWIADAVDTGGNKYVYPNTRVHFIYGTDDTSNAPALGKDYLNKLISSGSPMVTSETIPATPHQISATAAGMQAIENALLGF